jgi:hypothetical protein
VFNCSGKGVVSLVCLLCYFELLVMRERGYWHYIVVAVEAGVYWRRALVRSHGASGAVR